MSKEYLIIICGIYKITSPSGKIYIGQTVDVYCRWGEYKTLKCETQRLLYRSLKKYGAENHKFEIVEECNREQLNEREIHYIKFFDTFNTPHGLNLTAGGEGGAKSEETKKVMSEAAFKKWKNIPIEDRKLSEEHKRKIGKASEGNQYRLGTKHDEDVLKKISESSKINSQIYWDNLKNDPEGYKKRCQIYSEAQTKYSQEQFMKECDIMGVTPDELRHIKKEKRKEQTKRAYDTWREKNYNSERNKIKRKEKAKRSYYKNIDKRKAKYQLKKEMICQKMKVKYQLEKEIIRQERLTMIF